MTIGSSAIGIKNGSRSDACDVKSFEIIRFVEYGGQCHPEADCATGELLIFRLRRCQETEQAVVLGWIRQLARQMELLYQCRGTCGYRYLNPYSVLVTPEEKVFLLDLDAEGNTFVLRSMQKRVIRNNFIQADYAGERGAPLRQDLYGFAKTVQFIMANVTIRPRLSRLQERRLELMINRCTGKSGRKRCENFSRIQKAIPSRSTGRLSGNNHHIRIWGIVLFFCVCMIFLFIRLLAEQSRAAQLENRLEEYKAEVEARRIEKSSTETTAAIAGGKSDTEESDIEKLNQLLLNNNTDDNREVIERGEELHCEVLRCLAPAYDREGMTDKALSVYEELCVMGTEDEILEQAYSRRIALEEERNNGEIALNVAEKAVESLPDSQEIALLYLEMLYRYGIETEDEYRKKENEILAGFPELRESEAYQLLKDEKGEGSE